MISGCPVVFLDVDGVLIAYPEGEATPRQFTRRCVNALRLILDNVPGVKIVFSTTWRLPPHVDQLHQQWLAHKLPVELAIDGTPDSRTDASVSLYQRRGREIEQWLAAHPAVKRWVAIDDERMGIEEVLEPARCIFTDPRRGLEFQDAERVIGILSERL